MADALRQNILIVDDVPANVFMVKAILESEGLATVGASNAQEALQALEEQNIHLILLDIMMPDVNGYEVSRRVKELPGKADIPIIFLSALTEKEQIVEAFAAGGVDYISKPFHKPELLMRVKTHLALFQTKQELKEKNLLLERVAQELRGANLARDKFVSILAHDLRNPLAGLLSLVDLLAESPSDVSKGEYRDIVLTVSRTTRSVYNLLETLLDWGRTQSGTLIFQFREFSAGDALKEAVSIVESQALAKNITLELELSEAIICGDRTSLTTVFRNLLTNACKFTARGGRVRVSAVPDGPVTRVEIQDTGVGMDPETLAGLFVLDSPRSVSGTEQERGTGLGLLLCREFLDRNQASMSIESTPGVGTRFSLVFPSEKDGVA